MYLNTRSLRKTRIFSITNIARCCQSETVKKYWARASRLKVCLLNIRVPVASCYYLPTRMMNSRFLWKIKIHNFSLKQVISLRAYPPLFSWKDMNHRKKKKLESFSFDENFDDKFSVKNKLRIPQKNTKMFCASKWRCQLAAWKTSLVCFSLQAHHHFNWQT